MNPTRLLLTLFLLAISSVPVRAQAPVFTFRSIGPGLYASVTADAFDPSSYANAVVIEGEEGVLVVDTHHSPSAGRALAEAIRAKTSAPVRWIVNTHWHGDHLWGNSAVLEAWPEARVLGHPATRDRLLADGPAQVSEERVRLGGRIGRVEAALVSGGLSEADEDRAADILLRSRAQLRELEALEIVPPGEPVADRLVLDLGGRQVVVLHPGPAHTAGDLVVWVPDAGFLAAGDLVEEAPLWLEGADVPGWSRALARLEELGPSRVLPSHGRYRPDAGLLTAHADFLDDAVALVEGVTPPEGAAPDSTAWLGALEGHRQALESYGVEDGEFEAYVAAVRRALTGEGDGG